MCLAVPGRVDELLPASDGLEYAVVNFDGVSRVVCTACLPDLKVNDYVLVHAGVALTRMDTEEADRLIASLRLLTGDDDVDRNDAHGPDLSEAS